MRRVFAALCVVLALLALAGCAAPNSTIAKISAPGGEVPCVQGDENSFPNYMSANPALQYVPLGAEISVGFDGAPPDAIGYSDTVLNGGGTAKFQGGGDMAQTPAFSRDGGTYTFSLGVNYAVFASSDSADYGPGAVIRGIVLRCTWADRSASYAFVVRTDAE